MLSVDFPSQQELGEGRQRVVSQAWVATLVMRWQPPQCSCRPGTDCTTQVHRAQLRQQPDCNAVIAVIAAAPVATRDQKPWRKPRVVVA